MPGNMPDSKVSFIFAKGKDLFFLKFKCNCHFYIHLFIQSYSSRIYFLRILIFIRLWQQQKTALK